MARSNSKASGTATVTKSKRKAAPKPATREEATIDFARNVDSRLRSKLTVIHKHPTGKRQLTKARIDAFEELIRETSTAMTSHQLQKDGSAAATATEMQLRVALILQVRDIRDSVGALANVGKDIAHAFGVGKRLSPKTNADALLLAAAQQQAFANEEFAPTAEEAGITEEQISNLVSARRALSNAATNQSNALTAKAGQAIDKKALLKALAKETTAIRRIARIALRGNAAALKWFAPAPKTRTAKRAPKKTAATPAGTTAGTTGATTAQGSTTTTTPGNTTGQSST